MFDIAWSEMVVIGAVALIAIGPKDLPKALRAVGAMTAKARRMASEFQDHFREAMREAELESVQQEVANIKQDLAATTSGLQSEFNSIGSQMPEPSQPVVQPAAEAPKIESSTEGTALPASAGGGNEASAPDSANPDDASKPADTKSTTLSVEASPAAVTVTETAISPVGVDTPAEKPARKKRAAAKPKAKVAEASAPASQTDLLEIAGQAVANGVDGAAPAPAPVKAPRKRAAKALPPKPLPSGDDRAA
ncbi:twin arginine-targeting protein translocase TatB [Rhizobiales bacterium GAS113]|jgi:sec-independent protein translocase protein TatB|nr:twin arginine-targeting protein translocase TatB [Rhizobiales bacterium GAS113]